MFNIDQLRIDIETLLRTYPDLAEDEMLRADMLDGETDIRKALTLLFQQADNDKRMIEAIAARHTELMVRKSRFARRVEFLRALILKVLQSAELKKFELPEATLSQHRAQQQIVGEPDVEQLPADLVRVTTEPDRAKIREALKAGRDLPGLTLSNAAPALHISVK